jgi:hypothetical protein
MELEAAILERVRNWHGSSRWERAELGRDLRRHGLSYGEIMELVPVKKSTLATWCREVELTREQLEAVSRRRTPLPGRTLAGDRYTTQRPRRKEIEAIKEQASLEANHLQDDPFWSMGVALYWGEGSKSKRRLEMTHSEPEALRLFMKWARRFHRVDAEFSGAINLHFDNDEAYAREFWSTELDIPLDNFTKTFVKPDGTGHRKNHLAHGVCRATMRRSTDAWITTMAWIDFVKALHQR